MLESLAKQCWVLCVWVLGSWKQMSSLYLHGCMACITFDTFLLSMFQVPPEPQHEWYCAVCMTIVWMDHILLIHLAGAVQLSQECCCKHPWSVLLVLLGVHVWLGWLSHRISPWLTVWDSARVSLKVAAAFCISQSGIWGFHPLIALLMWLLGLLIL